MVEGRDRGLRAGLRACPGDGGAEGASPGDGGWAACSFNTWVSPWSQVPSPLRKRPSLDLPPPPAGLRSVLTLVAQDPGTQLPDLGNDRLSSHP